MEKFILFMQDYWLVALFFLSPFIVLIVRDVLKVRKVKKIQMQHEIKMLESEERITNSIKTLETHRKAFFEDLAKFGVNIQEELKNMAPPTSSPAEGNAPSSSSQEDHDSPPPSSASSSDHAS